MAAWDSWSSHVSCESADGYEDENVDILVKQLDVNVLMASLLEEKCVSLEQDGARGKKLCADVCAYLRKNKFLCPPSYDNENLLLKQKEILNKIIRSMAQNATEEEIVPVYEQSAAQNSRYRNEFKEIKRLGKGGFGTVFEAIHNLDGRKYAVKKIGLKQDADMTKPLREVRALARLKHENIMGYHNAWLEDDSRVSTSAGSSYDGSEGSSESTSDKVINLGQEHDQILPCQPAKKEKKMLCIQLELCNCTLQEWLQERNDKLQNTSMDYDTDDLPPDVKHIFHEILSGVSFIHSRGLMHRDLKPQNIFLFGQGLHVKIGDFGLVKGVCDSAPSSPTVAGVPVNFNANTIGIGSELYGSPELLRGKTCDLTCDMYSLGVILFELCNTFTTGMERFKSITHLRETNHCPRQLKKVWSERKVQLIEDLINPVPADRPTVQKVLSNPLFATATEDQILWKLNLPVQKQDQKFQTQDQKVQKHGQKVNKPDQTFEKQDHKLKKPDQMFEKQDHKLKKPDQKFKKQDQKFKKPHQKIEKQDQKFKKPDQTFQEQGQQSEEQDQKVLEHALNSSREANPDIGFTPKNKK